MNDNSQPDFMSDVNPQENIVDDRQDVIDSPSIGDKYREETHDVDDYLQLIEDRLKSARKVPFSDMVMVDRDEMLYFADMLRELLPNELRQARWLLQQHRQFILEARKEADVILRDAENKMARMIDEHEVTQSAMAEAQRIVDNATSQSRNLQNQTLDYAKQVLSDLETHLTEMLVYIQKNKKDLE